MSYEVTAELGKQILALSPRSSLVWSGVHLNSKLILIAEVREFVYFKYLSYLYVELYHQS